MFNSVLAVCKDHTSSDRPTFAPFSNDRSKTLGSQRNMNDCMLLDWIDFIKPFFVFLPEQYAFQKRLDTFDVLCCISDHSGAPFDQVNCLGLLHKFRCVGGVAGSLFAVVEHILARSESTAVD